MEEILKIDGKDFLVVKEILHNNNKYLYVISVDEKSEVAILKETVENNETFIESVDDEKERNEILKYINQLHEN